jgi:hypothetical protein
MLMGRGSQTATGYHGPEKENARRTVPIDNPDAFAKAIFPISQC